MIKSVGHLFLAAMLISSLSACSQILGLTSSDDGGPKESSPEDMAQAVRIQSEFTRLGMNDEGSECYAQKIDERLDGERLVSAADIVASAATSEEVRSGVMGGGKDMQTAFVAARFGCPMVN